MGEDDLTWFIIGGILGFIIGNATARSYLLKLLGLTAKEIKRLTERRARGEKVRVRVE